MKKALITLIATVLLTIIIMLLCMCLVSCTDSSNNSNSNNTASNGSSFTVIEQGKLNEDMKYTIFYDRKTLVMYMVVKSYDSKGHGNVMVMLDKDGKPLLYDKDKDKE